jgi:osmotically-inducible protein OsmY
MRLFFAKFMAVCMLAAGLALPIPLAAATHATSKAHWKSPGTDAQIAATLHAKLAKAKIGKDGFRFRVHEGVVTWEGITHVAQHKGAATRMAKSAGARKVVNNILVSSGKETHGGSGLKRAKVEW